ncbi:hypothetical protein CYY_004749 [Polysphondylium violaceum]|uniref:Small ribosomal subunit protein mS35 mitochondrial conserved domain-containing protein n=1 Tax=Polysphondylium violaceum TaxID=133409 RepID=A0A8J4PW12_9MYCE|nr:hypothetical protein CYY_004749 [Polysphondylium violaceum]
MYRINSALKQTSTLKLGQSSSVVGSLRSYSKNNGANNKGKFKGFSEFIDDEDLMVDQRKQVKVKEEVKQEEVDIDKMIANIDMKQLKLMRYDDNPEYFDLFKREHVNIQDAFYLEENIHQIRAQAKAKEDAELEGSQFQTKKISFNDVSQQKSDYIAQQLNKFKEQYEKPLVQLYKEVTSGNNILHKSKVAEERRLERQLRKLSTQDKLSGLEKHYRSIVQLRNALDFRGKSILSKPDEEDAWMRMLERTEITDPMNLNRLIMNDEYNDLGYDTMVSEEYINQLSAVPFDFANPNSYASMVRLVQELEGDNLPEPVKDTAAEQSNVAEIKSQFNKLMEEVEMDKKEILDNQDIGDVIAPSEEFKSIFEDIEQVKQEFETALRQKEMTNEQKYQHLDKIQKYFKAMNTPSVSDAKDINTLIKNASVTMALGSARLTEDQIGELLMGEELAEDAEPKEGEEDAAEEEKPAATEEVVVDTNEFNLVEYLKQENSHSSQRSQLLAEIQEAEQELNAVDHTTPSTATATTTTDAPVEGAVAATTTDAPVEGTTTTVTASTTPATAKSTKSAPAVAEDKEIYNPEATPNQVYDSNLNLDQYLPKDMPEEAEEEKVLKLKTNALTQDLGDIPEELFDFKNVEDITPEEREELDLDDQDMEEDDLDDDPNDEFYDKVAPSELVDLDVLSAKIRLREEEALNRIADLYANKEVNEKTATEVVDLLYASYKENNLFHPDVIEHDKQTIREANGDVLIPDDVYFEYDTTFRDLVDRDVLFKMHLKDTDLVRVLTHQLTEMGLLKEEKVLKHSLENVPISKEIVEASPDTFPDFVKEIIDQDQEDTKQTKKTNVDKTTTNNTNSNDTTITTSKNDSNVVLNNNNNNNSTTTDSINEIDEEDSIQQLENEIYDERRLYINLKPAIKDQGVITIPRINKKPKKASDKYDPLDSHDPWMMGKPFDMAKLRLNGQENPLPYEDDSRAFNRPFDLANSSPMIEETVLEEEDTFDDLVPGNDQEPELFEEAELYHYLQEGNGEEWFRPEKIGDADIEVLKRGMKWYPREHIHTYPYQMITSHSPSDQFELSFWINRKVILRVNIAAFNLPQVVEQRLADLTGKRYNPITKVLTLVCDNQKEQSDNKFQAKRLFNEILYESCLADPNFVPTKPIAITATEESSSSLFTPSQQAQTQDKLSLFRLRGFPLLSTQQVSNLQLSSFIQSKLN